MSLMEAGRLNDDTFKTIVRNAPLISIDLIIRDTCGKILVGMRTNEPAKGFYFVPGGVIRKNETLADAFSRIVAAETGRHANISEAEFAGVFEHFYKTNRYEEPGYGTHYVVLAYRLAWPDNLEVTADDQHSHFKWIDAAELSRSSQVHENSRAYARV